MSFENQKQKVGLKTFARVGYEVGYDGWLRGLVVRLVTRVGYKGRLRGLVTKVVRQEFGKTIKLFAKLSAKEFGE